MKNTFLEKVRTGINQFPQVPTAVRVGRQQDRARDEETIRVTVEQAVTTTAAYGLAEGTVDERLVGKVANEVYGDVRDELDKFIAATGMGDEEKAELQFIREMMQ